MQRLTLGDFELTAVSDGDYFLDGGAYFGVVPKVLWERKVKVDEKNRVLTGLNSVVVRNDELTILIETGVGNKLPEKMRKIHGMPAKLLDNLAASGIAPEDIDIVINSHLHFDHAGWNTVTKNGKPVPTFPNAVYYSQKEEWVHAHENQRDGVSYFSDNYDPLVENGQMKLLEGDGEICPFETQRPEALHCVAELLGRDFARQIPPIQACGDKRFLHHVLRWVACHRLTQTADDFLKIGRHGWQPSKGRRRSQN